MPLDVFKFLDLKFCEYLEHVIFECFENDETYRKDSELINELSALLGEGQAPDSPLILLMDAMVRQESCNRDAVYWQGWKDCVELLQKIKLLPVPESRNAN